MGKVVLIDTNIFIYLEEKRGNLDSCLETREFFNLIHELGFTLAVHDVVVKELNNSKGDELLSQNTAKVEKYYQKILRTDVRQKDLVELFGHINPNRSNDLHDCHLLYSLVNNAADFLITKDEKIIRRALACPRIEDVENRIFRLEEFIGFLKLYKGIPTRADSVLVTEDLVATLNLEDDLFISLENDYKGFRDWIKKCIKEKRRCWKILLDDNLAGLVIYKKEAINDSEMFSNADFDSNELLKICTFKISDRYQRRRLSELLIKEALLYCLQNQLPSVYLTVFAERQPELVYFLESFGFSRLPQKNSLEESIFIKVIDVFKCKNKEIIKHYLENPERSFPRIIYGNDTSAYFVPIQLAYYQKLFPTNPTKQKMFSDLSPQKISIKKSYLCNANTKDISINSIIFFYVSSPIQKVLSIGVVQNYSTLSNIGDIMKRVGRRIVYNEDEIRSMLKRGNGLKVLTFNHIKDFSLEDQDIQNIFKEYMKTHPQSITKVLNAKDLLDTLLLGSCAELKNLVIRYEDMGTYLTSSTSSPSEPLSLTSLPSPLPTDH
jgi:rRNA-processing protein FCF1